MFHFSSTGGSSWNDYGSYDFCFKTFGGGGPPVPVLSYDPISFDFGSLLEGVTDSTSFDVWNSGTGALTYSLSESCSWVSVSPSGGVSSGEHDSITVDVDTSGLGLGGHSCDISITSDGGSGIFSVDVIVVEESPVLAYSPTSFDFGSMSEGTVDSTSFEVWNSGTGLLTYTLSESCSWVDITPSGGDSSGEHDTIIVDVDTSGLSDGVYHCDIGIVSDGGSGSFGVDLEVVSGGEVEDVVQDVGGYNFMVYGSRWAAQSFIPGIDSLSSVELLLSPRGSPSDDLVVCIRDSLSGGDLCSVVVSAGEFPGSADWVVCDLPDISLTPGGTYYVVVYSSGGSVSNCIQWLFGMGTGYGDGMFHFSSTGGSSWNDYGSYDFCFKTFGNI
jgi:hypothetical protein